MMLMIYGFDSSIHKCVYCDNAKRFCTQKGIQYEFINVMPEPGVFDDAVIAELLTKLGRDTSIGLTMPQIFEENGTYIGGFDELRKHKLHA